MIPIITHKATFKRLEPDNADSDKEGFVNINGLVGISCNIQPVTSNPAELSTGMFGKSHILYIWGSCSGIREGQRVIISGLYDSKLNRELFVEGVEDWSYALIPHYEVSLSENLR